MRSTLLYFFIALILVPLGACQPTADPVPVKPAFVPKDGLTPDERNIEARDLLQVGNEEQARVELERLLEELPADKNSLARNLMEQITRDPVEILGSKYFRYEIVEGESLSLIAKKFLGDPLKFYVLARYNDIDNPSLVKAGDVIKVPGEKPEEEVVINPPPVPAPPVPTPPVPEPPVVIVPEPKNEAEVKELLAKAGEAIDDGNYEVAIDDLKTGLVKFPDSKAIKELRADAYIKLGEKHVREGEYANAQSVFEKAANLYPGRTDISRGLAEAGRAVKADDVFLDGLKYFERDNEIDAYESYLAALKMWY